MTTQGTGVCTGCGRTLYGRERGRCWPCWARSKDDARRARRCAEETARRAEREATRALSDIAGAWCALAGKGL